MATQEGSEEVEIETLHIDSGIEESQVAQMVELRARRDPEAVECTLRELRESSLTGENLVPRILECARAYCTLYEIRRAMEDVFGSYKEPVFF